jgi:very-short-patch-repair endonuclease
MNSDLDRLAREWASKHHGVFRRQWALDAGATPRMLKRRVQDAIWVPVGAAAFLIGGAPLIWEGRLQAAAWDGGDRTLVSHASAAQLLRFPGFYADEVHILVPKSMDHVCTIADVHESRRFDRVRSTTRDGLPMVAPEDTLVHLAPQLRLRRLDWLLDELVAGRKVNLPLLHKVFAELSPGCKGMKIMRGVLKDRLPGEPVPESMLERKFLDIVTARGLPPFQRQVNIPGRDQRPGRVDFLWPDVRLIVEVDGRRWHTRRADFERDSRRRLAMRAHGYSTVPVTWLMLTEEPDEVCNDLLSARAA